MQFQRRLFIVAALSSRMQRAWAQAPGDARLKAKLALTLARFTQWPAGRLAAPGEPLLMCVLHRDGAIAEAFAELAGQTVAGHPVRVSANPEKSLADCHVLFVHASAAAADGAAPAITATLPATLTIGDAEGFSARGGMVELVNVNDTTRLDVNLKVLRAAQLGLSSQVLKLARNIRE